MRCLFILQLMHLCVSLSAQNYAAIDERALHTPPSVSTNDKQLAQYLCKNLEKEEEKVRAIYAWLALNITYADSTDGNDLWASPDDIRRQRPESVLKNKTAVCQGYSNLFHALCNEAGIQTEVVTGICKQPDGRIPRIGHAWVAAKINQNWRLFDPTWGAPKPGEPRQSPNEAYFMAQPETFVLSHLPDDPMWQLLNNPISEDQFRNESTASISAWLQENTSGNFSYPDTLVAWQKLDSLQRFESAAKRMLAMNPENERITFNLGGHYYIQFYDQYFILDSLTGNFLRNPAAFVDSNLVSKQIGKIKTLIQQSAFYFQQVQQQERRQKIAMYLHPGEADQILLCTMADYDAAMQAAFVARHSDKPAPGCADTLIFYHNRALKRYESIVKTADCSRLPELCRNAAFNATSLQLEAAHFIADILQDAMQTGQLVQTHAKRLLPEAFTAYTQALERTQSLKQLKPPFQFILDWETNAREGLVSLKLLELRLAAQPLYADVQTVLSPQHSALSKAESVLKSLKAHTSRLLGILDSIKTNATLSADYQRGALHYLLLDIYAQHINAANLEYRIALQQYKETQSSQDIPQSIKETIIQHLNNAQKHLKTVRDDIDELEDVGMSKNEDLEKKRSAADQLEKSVVQFLARL